MTVFSDAVDDIFENDDMAVDGTYTPNGGAGVSVRAIFVTGQDPMDPFGGGKTVTRIKADIRVSEVTSVADGDALKIGAITYTMHGPMKKDARGLIWTSELTT